jgi:hypothetical protein
MRACLCVHVCVRVCVCASMRACVPVCVHVCVCFWVESCVHHIPVSVYIRLLPRVTVVVVNDWSSSKIVW